MPSNGGVLLAVGEGTQQRRPRCHLDYQLFLTGLNCPKPGFRVNRKPAEAQTQLDFRLAIFTMRLDWVTTRIRFPSPQFGVRWARRTSRRCASSAKQFPSLAMEGRLLVKATAPLPSTATAAEKIDPQLYLNTIQGSASKNPAILEPEKHRKHPKSNTKSASKVLRMFGSCPLASAPRVVTWKQRLGMQKWDLPERVHSYSVRMTVSLIL